MGNRVIQFADSDRWAVYQSTSETMYLPIFHNEISARIFCAHYDSLSGSFATDYSEQAQLELAAHIFSFVSSKLPDGELPAAWAMALDPAPYWWEESDGAWHPLPDLSELDSNSEMSQFFLAKLRAFIACESPANHCHMCDRPANDCACAENGGTY